MRFIGNLQGLSKLLKLRGVGIPAVVLAALYVACADPPKQVPGKGSAGSSGAIGEAGESDDGGSDATSGSGGSVAMGGSSDGKAGTTATAGKGGKSATGDDGGAPDMSGGEGGLGGESGEAGSGNTPPNACTGVSAGGKSKLPVPLTTGVAQPSGAVGGLKVIDWAGFKGAESYTLDDGKQSQIDNYPALKAVGIPLTFYLVGGNNAALPFWTTVAQDGNELGNHTMHHCYANGTQCGWGAFTDIDSEIDDDTVLIEKHGVKVYSMATPMGDDSYDIAASSRFLINRSVNDDPAGLKPNDTSNPYKLPCHITTLNETAAGDPDPSKNNPGLNKVTDSARDNGSWRIVLMHSFGGDDGYNPISITEGVAAMTYAKNDGHVWVDTMTTIGAYWRVQKVIKAVVPVTSGSDQVYSWTLPDHFPPGQFVRVTVTGGTVKQCGTTLPWDDHGYYEVALDAGSVTISP